MTIAKQTATGQEEKPIDSCLLHAHRESIRRTIKERFTRSINARGTFVDYIFIDNAPAGEMNRRGDDWMFFISTDQMTTENLERGTYWRPAGSHRPLPHPRRDRSTTKKGNELVEGSDRAERRDDEVRHRWRVEVDRSSRPMPRTSSDGEPRAPA